MKYAPRTVDVASGTTLPLRPVFGIDIDGTIGQYHRHFSNFAEAYFGKPMPTEDYDGSVSFATWLGVSKPRYRRAKLAYRQGGAKRSMPSLPGYADAIGRLRRRGALVVYCTTRPYLSLENIDADTREFLRRNGFQTDGIIWGENKYRDLVAAYGRERIVAVVDDLPSLLVQANGLGLDTFLASRPHNERARLVAPVSGSCRNARGFETCLTDRLHSWEKRHGYHAQG